MENLELEIEKLREELSSIYRDEEKIVYVINTIMEQLKIASLRCDNAIAISRNMKYEIFDPRVVANQGICYPVIKSTEETLQEILDKKCSIARFGDGEFAIMANRERQKFQNLNLELGKRLREVIRTQDERLLIGIADNYGNLEKFTQDAADKIRVYMTDEIRREQMQFLDLKRVYGNAYVTRPYVLMADNRTDAPKKRFENWKKVWDTRNVIIVEGAESRLGVGNDLFDNVLTLRRIIAPATNSYDRYPDILKSALNNAKRDDLFLIALGPAAGVMAYDLTQEGYQAIDLGHLDLEYEWFLEGEGKRVQVVHKYNNEFPGDERAQPIIDSTYEAQKIADFSS